MADEDLEPNYEAGVAYWDSIEPSVNGVLGGHGHADSAVPLLDALSSRLFLLSCVPGLSTIPATVTIADAPAPRTTPLKALDVGAGIGRITKDVLLTFSQHVDILETSTHFLDQAVKSLAVPEQTKSLRFFQNGMQFFNPESPQALYASHALDEKLASQPYDLIWIQWAAGHVSDDQLVAFLQRCRYALARPTAEDPEGGLIVVKENNDQETGFDHDDSSITRTNQDFHDCFERAGLKIIKEEVQQGFPQELLPVRSYALRPAF